MLSAKNADLNSGKTIVLEVIPMTATRHESTVADRLVSAIRSVVNVFALRLGLENMVYVLVPLRRLKSWPLSYLLDVFAASSRHDKI